jgi:hydroxyethylthiazole kinase-like uncharacterized protein yjeF
MTLDYRPGIFDDKSGQVGIFGPGMGTGKERERVLEAACASDWSLVLDADALTIIAARGEEGVKLLTDRHDRVTVITPHPKEASRLLGWEVAEVERDRYVSAQELATRFQCFVILKGKGTLITGPGRPVFVVTAGDTGLSKGGTGDTLTGIVASLLAQRVSPERGVPLGVYLHGRAAERVSQRHGDERSTLASEISDALPEVFKEIEWPAK